MSTAHDQLASWLELTVLILGEPECEFKHRGTPCGGTVTHRVTTSCGSPGGLVCSPAAQRIAAAMEDPKRVCAGCKRRAGDCWRLIPT